MVWIRGGGGRMSQKGTAQHPQEAEVRMSSTLSSWRREVSMGPRGCALVWLEQKEEVKRKLERKPEARLHAGFYSEAPWEVP